ncbi:MAG: hypothetical protein CVU62_12195 [Deltaproteobacteria bacterium HGW-Deltaproteobacteria-2]|nr:MAG: hypothetical protein CVU62_12195 [Deltaproteobacteria bacterium HGW-Deltaproteobacteria-2]
MFTSRIKASLFDKKQNLLFVGKEHSFFIGWNYMKKVFVCQWNICRKDIKATMLKKKSKLRLDK